MAKAKAEVAAKVEKDHAHINHDIGKIKISMMKEVSGEAFSNWKLEFVWELRDFKNRLLKHFDLEEEGGFMQDVLTIAPQSERKVKELKMEHSEIIADLDRILVRLKNMQGKDDKRLQEIRVALNDLTATLRQHETEEHELLQRAYYREYGGAD